MFLFSLIYLYFVTNYNAVSLLEIIFAVQALKPYAVDLRDAIQAFSASHGVQMVAELLVGL